MGEREQNSGERIEHSDNTECVCLWVDSVMVCKTPDLLIRVSRPTLGCHAPLKRGPCPLDQIRATHARVLRISPPALLRGCVRAGGKNIFLGNSA